MSNNIKLVFVFNADSGKLNAIKDSIKKIFNKAAYECNLCGVAFGTFGMKNDFKNFIQNLDVETDFLHKDEFPGPYPEPEVKEFPCCYLYKNGKMEIFINRDEMDSYQNQEELIEAVKKKVQTL